MKSKYQARLRRGIKTKMVIKKSNRPRLCVHRSTVHMYSQIIVCAENGDKVIVSASTLDKELKTLNGKNKSEQAYEVGKLLGSRAVAQNITDVAFDRAGYKYHGRVKALAEGAREAGLNF